MPRVTVDERTLLQSSSYAATVGRPYGHASGAIVARRDVWLPEAGGFVACAVYDRAALRAGNCISGPAIIEQMDATTLVLPGMVARVEPYLNVILEQA